MGKPLAVTRVPEKLKAEHLSRLRALVETHGLASVCEAARLDASTIMRALSSLPLRTPSIAAIILFLEAQ